MKSFLLLIFDELNVRGYRQGTIIDEIEPNEFYTYWNMSNKDEYSNNVPLIFKNTYQVCFYCKEENLINDKNYLEIGMNKFIEKARSYGLVVNNVQDFASGLDGYISMMCRVEYAQHDNPLNVSLAVE